MNELEAFRAEKDDFFGHDHQSPLTRDQKREFKGLDYFPENPNLRLEIKVEEFPNKERIEMQTSTGDVQIYFRYSRFSFRVDGQDAELTIYEGPNGSFCLLSIRWLERKRTPQDATSSRSLCPAGVS